MGKLSQIVAAATFVMAVLEFLFGGSAVGGDIAGMVAFVRALTIARIGFWIGIVLALVGLWRDETRAPSVGGLILNVGAEMALAAYMGPYWFALYW